jgi:hypothetical protein
MGACLGRFGKVVADDSTTYELLRGLKKLYTVSRLGLGRYVASMPTADLEPPSMGPQIWREEDVED